MSTQNFTYFTDSLPSGYPLNGGTGNQFNLISTIGMLTVGKGAHINDEYMLKEPLIAEVKWEDNRYVVVEYRIDEYGIGESVAKAQKDLLDSLVDYRGYLEKREKKLGDKERQDLEILRNILTKFF